MSTSPFYTTIKSQAKIAVLKPSYMWSFASFILSSFTKTLGILILFSYISRATSSSFIAERSFSFFSRSWTSRMSSTTATLLIWSFIMIFQAITLTSINLFFILGKFIRYLSIMITLYLIFQKLKIFVPHIY